MRFELRPLNYGDIAPMTQIISKIGVREFADVLSTQSILAMIGGATDQAKKVQNVSLGVVFEVIGIVMANFEAVSDDLAKFLGSVAGMTAEEVKALGLADTYDLVSEVFGSQDFKDFFTRASASLPKKEAGAAGLESSTEPTPTQ